MGRAAKHGASAIIHEHKIGYINRYVAPIKRVLKAEDTSIVLAKGGPVERDKAGAPAFKPGDVVCARNENPMGHTRLPRYLRSRQGVIHKARCAHVFPDTNARGEGEDPQWLYSVRFKATELWGDEANPKDHVHVDCWEPYLASAGNDTRSKA